MIRRAPACCCTLAVLCAAPLPAVALVNITHQCDNKFFQYEEDHPIGGNAWHYDIPPEYIPGGTSPSNACTRLTADTRLAFTGAFDAYFRRLMASCAFGTAECTNTAIGFIGEYSHYVDLQTAADWCSDHTITNIFFGRTNGWYLAANRDYAVTNITVTVSNWVGYVTNVVNVSGKPRVKVSNRYEVVSTNVLDTTRILSRYLRDHNAMRVKVDDSIRGMMVSTGVGEFMKSIPAPWPDRVGLLFGSNGSSYREPTDIRREDFLGWTFSDVAGPYLAPSAEWQQSLIELFRTAFQSYGGSFAYFFPTTWDLFGAQNSRDAIARDLRDDADIKYIDYPSVCSEDWDTFCTYMLGNGIGGGFAAMTNLVGYAINTNQVINNRQSFLPSAPLTNSSRIIWSDWAGTDAYLALCDTSIAGNKAMPKLYYDIESTTVVVSVTYRGAGYDKWLVVHSWPVNAGELDFHRMYVPTNVEFELVRDGVHITDSHGSLQRQMFRIEKFQNNLPEDGELEFHATGETTCENAGVSGYFRVGHNCIDYSILAVKGWLESYYNFYLEEPRVGDHLRIGSFCGSVFGAPYFYVDGPRGAAYDNDVGFSFTGDYYFDIRASNVVCEISIPIEVVTTRGPRPFDYEMATWDDSSPCLYPSPIYAIKGGGVDEIDGIYPTAIAAAGVTTNLDNISGLYVIPDTNGYYFALKSAAGLNSPKRVDDFWLDVDDYLADKMGVEVAAISGVNPRGGLAGVSADIAHRLDDLLTGPGNYFFIDLLRQHMAAHPVYDDTGGPKVPEEWLPYEFEITGVTQTPSGYSIDFEAVWYNPTNGVYEAMNPQPSYVRHSWSYSLDEYLPGTNVTFSSAAARGRLSGIEAVKWNFHSMHDARNSNP